LYGLWEDTVNIEDIVNIKEFIFADVLDNVNSVCKDVMYATSIRSLKGELYEGDIAKLLKRSLKGDAQAQYELAMAYIGGNNIGKKEKLGKSWLYMAAKNGNANAIAYVEKERDIQEKSYNDSANHLYGTGTKQSTTTNSNVRRHTTSSRKVMHPKKTPVQKGRTH